MGIGFNPIYAGDEQSEWLRGYLRAFHPYDSRERYLAVFYFHGDAAGTKNNRVYVAACYFGYESQWAEVDAKWAKALSWAKVDYFHATDFFSCQGEFCDWKRGSARHKKAAELFASIAADARLNGFAFGVETAMLRDPEYIETMDLMYRKYRGRSARLTAYSLCFTSLAKFLREHPLPPRERIIGVVEHEQGIGDVILHFERDKARGATWTDPILSIAPGDKKDLRPLQVADLLAYEAFQYLTRWVSNPEIGDSPTFARLLSTGRVEVSMVTLAQMRTMLPWLRNFFRKHPSGMEWGADPL